MVPLSFIIWSNEPYRALEMGIFTSALFWFASLVGNFFLNATIYALDFKNSFKLFFKLPNIVLYRM